MENLIVTLIVVLAGVYIARMVFKKFRKDGVECGCGCSSCDMKHPGDELNRSGKQGLDPSKPPTFP